MSLKVIRSLCAVIAISFTVVSAQAQIPKDGVLPDEKAAIKVAEAVLVNVYGESVLSERPFSAKIEGEYWVVTGTLHCPKGANCKGGIARIELNKKDGKVRRVIHGK